MSSVRLARIWLTGRVNGLVLDPTPGAAYVVRRLALVSFGLAIVLAPLRMRLVLQSRPVPPVVGDYTDLILYAADAFQVATLLLWLVGLALAPRALQVRPRHMTLALAGLTAVAGLSAAFAVDRPLAAYHALRLLLLFGIYLYVLNEVQTFGRLIAPVCVQVAAQSLVALGQVLQQHSLGLGALQEKYLDPSQGGVSVVIQDGLRSLRAYGLTDHPNILGGCLAFALLLLAAWYLRAGSRSRLLPGSAFLLGVAALLLTFSRSAWLGFVGGLALAGAWLWWSHRRTDLSRLLRLLAAALLIVLPLGWSHASALGARVNWDDSFTTQPTERRSINERLLLAGLAGQVFARHILTGSGIGTFPVALRQLEPRLTSGYQPPHVVLLDVAAETGLLGAACYVLLMGLPWWLMWRNRRRLAGSVELIGASAALLGVTIVGLFDHYPWMLAPGRTWQWLIWGLWSAAYTSALNEESKG